MKNKGRWEGAEGDPDTILQKMDNPIVKWEHHEQVEATDVAGKDERRRERQLEKNQGRRRAAHVRTLRPPYRMEMRLLLPQVKDADTVGGPIARKQKCPQVSRHNKGGGGGRGRGGAASKTFSELRQSLGHKGGVEPTVVPVDRTNRARAQQASAIQSGLRPRSQVRGQHSCIGHGACA